MAREAAETSISSITLNKEALRNVSPEKLNTQIINLNARISSLHGKASDFYEQDGEIRFSTKAEREATKDILEEAQRQLEILLKIQRAIKGIQR